MKGDPNYPLYKKEKRKSTKRGKYNMKSAEEKEKIIQHAKRYGEDSASKKFNISLIYIRRYLKTGAKRREGGGRKVADPELESNMVRWVKERIKESGKMPKNEAIKAHARSIKKTKSFSASKGWCAKFKRRNKSTFDKTLLKYK